MQARRSGRRKGAAGASGAAGAEEQPAQRSGRRKGATGVKGNQSRMSDYFRAKCNIADWISTTEE